MGSKPERKGGHVRSLSEWLSDVADRLYGFRRSILLVVHIAAIVVANQGAFWLRFDGIIPEEQRPYNTTLLPLVVLVRLAVFLPMRLDVGVWRYAGIWDLRNILVSVGASSSVVYVAIHWILGIRAYPRSVFMIDALLLVLLMGGLRLARRLAAVRSVGARDRRTLVYGAGDVGEMIVRDMLQNAEYDAQPVGFVDDDPHKVGERIHGVKVLGSRGDLPRIIEDAKPDEVLLTIPSAPPAVVRAIVRALEPYKVRITTVPRLADLVGERVNVGQIRQLKVEDLLAREPVALDSTPVREVLSGKRVLVTGAGGSIGSELCRQIAESGPAELMMLDRYENALYFRHRELADAHPSLGLQPVIGDVTDEMRVNQVLSQFRPQVVFHAAAHKHVPLMEDNPSEAVKNNVRGTRVMAEAAARHGVERFVLISTDKAVNPTSVMGAAKRVAEMLVTSFNGHSPTHFVAVRFGNVLASNGSVVPLFLSQIAKGGPVTVTHPEMRRYFMLIPEAVQLVLQAAAIGEDGDILVLDMGEQVKVAEMARDLIRLAGFIPDKDIEIAYTGVRPGEKLYEELVGADEHAEPSAVPKVLKIVSGVGNRPPSPRLWRPAEASSEGGESGVGRESGLDRDSQTDQRATPAHPAHLNGLLHALEQAALDGRDDDVIAHLCRIVPGFTPQARPLR